MRNTIPDVTKLLQLMGKLIYHHDKVLTWNLQYNNHVENKYTMGKYLNASVDFYAMLHKIK